MMDKISFIPWYAELWFVLTGFTVFALIVVIGIIAYIPCLIYFFANQRKDLAGAIRTESFLKPVPVSMGPDWKGIWVRAILVTLLLIFAITVFSGCTMPKTINFAPLATVTVKDSANGSANGNTVTPVAP